jgi:hypothetical protein
MAVRNSNINNNSYGIFGGVNGGTPAGATIEQTTLAFNVIGLYVQDPGAVGAMSALHPIATATADVLHFGFGPTGDIPNAPLDQLKTPARGGALFGSQVD